MCNMRCMFSGLTFSKSTFWLYLHRTFTARRSLLLVCAHCYCLCLRHAARFCRKHFSWYVNSLMKFIHYIMASASSRCNLGMPDFQYTQVSKEMSPELSQILRKCLEKQAKDRPSAQELLQLPSIAEVGIHLGWLSCFVNKIIFVLAQVKVSPCVVCKRFLFYFLL